MTLDELAKQQGFESPVEAEEMAYLVSNVPLNTPQQLHDFELWTLGDGTKAGLVRLFKEKDNGRKRTESNQG